jgi:hypothetical protein
MPSWPTSTKEIPKFDTRGANQLPIDIPEKLAGYRDRAPTPTPRRSCIRYFCKFIQNTRPELRQESAFVDTVRSLGPVEDAAGASWAADTRLRGFCPPYSALQPVPAGRRHVTDARRSAWCLGSRSPASAFLPPAPQAATTPLHRDPRQNSRRLVTTPRDRTAGMPPVTPVSMPSSTASTLTGTMSARRPPRTMS